MKAITLRNVPRDVLNAIRAKAARKGISINKAVIELLQERVGILEERKKTLHHDLDELAGSWNAREAKAFEETLELSRKIDDRLWR